MTTGYREFEFDLPDALLNRLLLVFDEMQPAPLDEEALKNVPEAQGIYQLFHEETLVYIGKTDAEAGLQKRLKRHSVKIQHRQGLLPKLVAFKAVRIFVFTAMDLETQLIKHYAGDGGTAWNNSGFGSNDPGRNRDRTQIGEKNFDAMYPIDIDRPLGLDLTRCRTAAEAALQLKQGLPYTFRYQSRGSKSRQPHPTLERTDIKIPSTAKTTRAIVAALTKQLPSGWQSTAFRSHVILYHERVDDYPDSQIIARS